MALRRVGKDLFDDDTAETVAEEYDRSCFLLFKVRFLFYPLTKMMKISPPPKFLPQQEHSTAPEHNY
jgi:hypothetical protein